MKTNECDNCHRSSKETEGWWTVSELNRTYELCPRCYRNRSLLAYRDTLLEAMLRTEISHSDPLVKLGMEIMHGHCANIIRDTKFNG
jgi:NAD-dependent SIR2 family protein deacetylase